VDDRKRGLGTDLLIDALRRCLTAADTAGARAVITHAIDDDAVAFYERHGFLRSPLGERTLLMRIETVRAFVG
jgi:GNAT superfamily N-acetyltransferase